MRHCYLGVTIWRCTFHISQSPLNLFTCEIFQTFFYMFPQLFQPFPTFWYMLLAYNDVYKSINCTLDLYGSFVLYNKKRLAEVMLLYCLTHGGKKESKKTKQNLMCCWCDLFGCSAFGMPRRSYSYCSESSRAKLFWIAFVTKQPTKAVICPGLFKEWVNVERPGCLPLGPVVLVGELSVRPVVLFVWHICISLDGKSKDNAGRLALIFIV